MTLPETLTVIPTAQVMGVFAMKWEAMGAKCGLRESDKWVLSEEYAG